MRITLPVISNFQDSTSSH